jgi:hypothetical protein
MKFPSAVLLCALALPCMADEGLWLFNQFPQSAVREKYTFDVTGAFLENLRLSSLEIAGGAGAFVSPRGLLLTNQHLVSDCAPADGFYAAAPAAELSCHGLEARVLVALEDVTAQVKPPAAETAKNAKAAAIAAQTAEALQKRNAAIARIEKACAEKTGNTCNVVRLSSGERYDLYQYRKYTDLRLVFAPERAIAFFGGNPEKLTYPRYDLDIAFLRAYQNGQPADTPHYLKWSAEGVKDGDLVFAAGSPVSTERLATAAQLTFYRDYTLPVYISHLQTRIEDLRAFAVKTPGNLQQAQPILTVLGADYKLTAGKLIGLRDDWLFARKNNFEKKLKQAVQHDPKLGADAVKVWDDVATAYKNWQPYERPYQVLERPAAIGSNLFRIAREVVRLSEERGKPNEQRLPDYRESALPSLETELYSPAPFDDAVETVLLTRYLQEIRALGDREAPLKAIFGAKTPQQAAEEMVRATKLKDVAERKRLAADHKAVAESGDPMVRLARLIEDPARKLQKKHQELIESLEVTASERIAQYRYRLFGAADYPDATGTPRVTFGQVKAYKDRTQAPVPYATTFGGLYHLAVYNQEPYKLPQRWVDGKASLDLVTPMNFVSTCDITSGPSGPVVDKKGELVGITFDGNLESIALTYMYADETARAVHVASQGIAESLQRIYKAHELLHELGVAGIKPATE